MKSTVFVAFFFLHVVFSFNLIPTPTWRRNSMWCTRQEALSRAEKLMKTASKENLVSTIAMEIMELKFREKLSAEKLADEKKRLEDKLADEKKHLEDKLADEKKFHEKLSEEKLLSEKEKFEIEKKGIEKEQRSIQRSVQSYFERELSFVVQRAALEVVFKKVRDLLYEKDVSNYLSTILPPGFDFKRNRETMSGINTVLENKAARGYLFDRLNCTCIEDFPVFDKLLLFGGLSEIVHRPYHKEILVSDKADSRTKRFWECIAGWCEKGYKEYDEINANEGEEIVANQRNIAN